MDNLIRDAENRLPNVRKRQYNNDKITSSTEDIIIAQIALKDTATQLTKGLLFSA
jgi:hypothetical protein